MQVTQQILLVVNPVSAHKDKTEIVKSIKSLVRLQGKDVLFYRTTGKDDKIKVRELIEKNQNIERIIAIGGDGTIKLIAEAMTISSIPMGIVPMGSSNAMAVNLGISLDVREAIKTAFGNAFIIIDSIQIDGELCLHMSDFGLNAALIKNYEESKFRGKIGYLLQSIPTLLKSDYPYSFTVKTGDEEINEDGVLLVIANAQKYGTGANVNPKGKLNDQFYEILIFKSLNAMEILKTLRNEEALDPNFVKTISVKEAKIICKNPVHFQIDGEYRGEKDYIETSLSKQRYRIAIPMKNK
ncbi:MAG TPA: diacylglycerol kinase family protein [Salinimicrobium sp.]|nr:diacylglycerol kinase family protein [Salinimicrobium sp.]